MNTSELKNLLTKYNDIKREIESRKNDKLNNYNKGERVHLKQLKFHKNQSRNRWVFGGNRTGKTECGAVECVWLLRGIHPYRENKPGICGWAVSLSREVQREVAQNKILSYLKPDWIAGIVMVSGKASAAKYGVIDYILIKNVFGGISKLVFKSCDQGREKFQGASLDFVWFDEEPPEDIYDECRMRVLDRCGCIFGTMTPLKGLSYVYDKIYLSEDKDTWCISMEWADNPYLDKDEIKRLSAILSKSELESRRYGKFTDNCGLVYPEFDPDVHIIEPFTVPYEWYDNISIDPGLNNPLSAHWYAVDYDGNVYVIAEHYEAKRDIQYHSEKIKEICEKLNWKVKNGRYQALIDSAATQKTLASSKSVSELFFEMGIAVNPKVNKDIFSGIQRVKRYLKPIDSLPKLYIFKNCINMIREIKGYRWGEGDSPKKISDHSMDELRYYIMSKPEVPVPKAVFNEFQKDEKRLIRKLSKTSAKLQNIKFD